MYYLNRIVVLILLVLFTNICFAASVTISGYIYDDKSGETLISSSVFDTKSGKGTVSNNFGFYSLTIPDGEVELRYSYVGYVAQVHKFKLTKDTAINIRLIPSTELKEVTVTGNYSELGVRGSQMGTIEVPIAQIKSIPALLGEVDVIKALQLLPGVQGGTEGSAGLYVRGGGPDENLLLLDGIPIYNVNHAAGFFSVFNADAIKNVTLYKGSFPARYGGRLSSVVDIRMNDGHESEYHGNVSIGLISSKINLEGPVIKEKTTFNISARRTYFDILSQPLIKLAAASEGGNISAGYFFYDLNAKISHKFSERDRLFLSFYMGDDVIYTKFKMKDSGDSYGYDETMSMDWDWGNFITALRWNHVVNNKLFMNTTAAFTRYRFKLAMEDDYTYKSQGEPDDRQLANIQYNSGIYDWTAKVDFDYTPSPNHDVKFGANYTYHTFKPGVSSFLLKDNTAQIDTTMGDLPINAHETILYVEDNITLNNIFKANAGLHYSAFFVQKEFYHSLQPRLSMRALINDRFSLKAGYAYMSQYIHLLSNSSISLPTDLWVPVTKKIVPMNSHQVSLGAFYEFPQIADLSIESYYKSLNNVIEYKDGASFLGTSTGWEEKVSMGRGWAYGIEFLAQRSFGNTTGWIGYTWSHTNRLFDRSGQELSNGEVFPAKYDRRHDLKLVVSHKLSERIDFSATWVYGSGNWGTLGLHEYSGLSGYSQLTYISNRNNFQLNPYHRLDLGINFHKKKKHGTRTWNISVYNAYNNMNPFMVYPHSDGYYDAYGNWKEKKTLRQITIFPIIPSVSYSYKF